MWLSPKAEAGCRIEGGGVLAELIRREWRELEGIYAHIAVVHGVTTRTIQNDFDAILMVLAESGLLEMSEMEVEGEIREAKAMGIAGKNTGNFGNVMGFWKDNRIPAELHIDLTSACTERCVHCYYPEHQKQYLPFEVIGKALREFRTMGGLTVHLTGGECMLHPQFEPVCRLCVELDLNIIILSNLTLCETERVAFLREIRPQFINVSLYSMDEAEHDAITQVPRSWQRTIGAIEECERAGVAVRLAVPLLKGNRKAFPGLKRFAEEHGLHLVSDCTIVPQTNQDCSNLDHACSVAELEETLRETPDIFDWGLGRRPIPGLDDRVCNIGEGRLCLNAEGNYYPCDGMHGFVLGNARQRTVAEIWHGEKLEALRRLKNRDFDGCATCRHRSFCKVCPAFNFNATGNVLKTIPEKCAVSAVLHRVYGRAG